jgi:DNA-binding protein HU-beta
MSTYTKKDLAADVRAACSIKTANQAEEIVDAVLTNLRHAILEKKEITLRGLFTIKPGVSLAKTGRNPQTGEPVHIPAKRKIRVVVSTGLKDDMNA